MKKKILLNLVATVSSLVISQIAIAQSSNDMWTAQAKNDGAYDPHSDNCDSSEVFVAVADSNLGFCIEKNERSAAVWVAAKKACADDGKRLPEPSEWQQACKVNPSGITNMTDDWEFASNIPYMEYMGSGVLDLQVIRMGGGGCTYANSVVVGRNTGGEETFVFRCVR